MSLVAAGTFIFVFILFHMSLYYIPFSQVKNQKTIVVDSLHPRSFVLAHWRGAPTPSAVRGDTSADIVFNALHQNLPELAYQAVSANHFDVDGFVGVWALLNPELALLHENTLREMARIGDFRELNLSKAEADLALKMVCWINAWEKGMFYPPFGTEEMEENEIVASVPKFEYFLREFGQVLKHPETEKEVWEPEYQQVRQDYAVLHSAETNVKTYPEIGLIMLDTPEPTHYYALFSLTMGYDIVLTRYAGHRYELEYKYTTWIDLDSRPTLPRISLKPLKDLLNKLELSDYTWTAESVTDTGPILRLSAGKLSRTQRYANPTERPVYASSIAAEVLEGIVVRYFREAYRGIMPKKYWSWEEIKSYGKPTSKQHPE